ncbi:MAG: sulfur oxidation c-type cytochrome SoxA [Aquimonas sp.]|jgi:L-cysteine S-thiosulfotransferase|nr:sulfur oxidation c-type cytochrome SoxA [Aquimonas sp.]
MKIFGYILITLIASVPPHLAKAEEDIFAEYRAMFGDDSPAVLVEMDGEALWSAPGGEKNVSLETCDLGLGPGVVDGAYAQLPRYFSDTDKVMDLETRLLWCMETIQGMDTFELHDRPFSEQGSAQTALEQLSAFIAARSNGVQINVPQGHPKEVEAFESGRRLFNFRAGPHDFSCATCHSQDGKRIRLQSLLQLNDPKGAKQSFSTWPAYRISQGAVRTIEWRMADCARQQRLPGLVFGSEFAIDLITYLGVQANGEPMNVPGLKR